MSTGLRNSATVSLRLQKALMLQAETTDSLRIISGLSTKAVRHWINLMRESNVIHIESWAKDTRGRLMVAKWRWGCKTNAARPGPQRTSADRMRDSRARRKAAQC